MSCATRPLTRMFPVISFISHVTLYDMRSSPGTSPRLPLCHYDVSLRHDDVAVTSSLIMLISLSSAIDSYLSRLAGSRYAQFSTRFVSPLVTDPTGRYSCPLLLRLLHLFVLVVLVLV